MIKKSGFLSKVVFIESCKTQHIDFSAHRADMFKALENGRAKQGKNQQKYQHVAGVKSGVILSSFWQLWAIPKANRACGTGR